MINPDRETLKLIQKFYILLESAHPARRRIIATKILEEIMPFVLGKGEKVDSRYDADLFTRAKQVGGYLIHHYGKVGYLLLEYFIKYHEIC
jgi:hypothetical protein